MEKIKVEAKGSLFKVSISSGCYSDWTIETYVFAGNSIEEVWEFVKIWAKETKQTTPGLVFRGEKFKCYKPTYGEEIVFDTDYGDASNVEIERLSVIYVN